jgi:putative membrane protein
MEQWVFIISIIGYVLSGLVALLHLYILILESLLWRRVAGKTFKLRQDIVEASAVLAANQGAYNGVLAAGLIWGISIQDLKILFFFLLAVVGVGIFGALTASPRIFLVQVVPALLSLAFICTAFFAQGYDIALFVTAGVVVVVCTLLGIYVRLREQNLTGNMREVITEDPGSPVYQRE